MKKSVDGDLVRTETKHAQGNGIRAEASVRHSSKLTNSETNSKEAKSCRRVSVTSSPRVKHSAVEFPFGFCFCSFYLLVFMLLNYVLSHSLEGLLQ